MTIGTFRCRLLGHEESDDRFCASAEDAVEAFLTRLPEGARVGATIVVVEPRGLFSRAHYFLVEWFTPDVYAASRTTFEGAMNEGLSAPVSG